MAFGFVYYDMCFGILLVNRHLECVLTKYEPQNTDYSASDSQVHIHINLAGEIIQQCTDRNDYEYVRHAVNKVCSTSYESYEKRYNHHYDCCTCECCRHYYFEI